MCENLPYKYAVSKILALYIVEECIELLVILIMEHLETEFILEERCQVLEEVVVLPETANYTNSVAAFDVVASTLINFLL